MKKFLLSVLSFLLFVILIIAVLVGYLFLRYRGWEKEFLSSIQSEYVITSESVEELDIDTKVSKFALSSSDTEFLELEVKEVGSVLFMILDDYIAQDIDLLEMYIEPDEGVWLIYLHLKYKEISLWFSFDIKKDGVQTAQLYTSSIYLGPFSVHKYTDWIDLINKGIGESIVTLNENGFVGRYLENIELLNSSIVIKGSRY